MPRVLLHTGFWLCYLFQDVLLIFLVNTSRIQAGTGPLLLLSFLHCIVLLLPKFLLTYFILYATLGKMIREGFETTSFLYSLLALGLTLLLYRGLVVFFVNPVIYGWGRMAASFFDPLAFLVALMDTGFVCGAAVALNLIRLQFRSAKLAQQLVTEKLETELKYLRNQTHPHFLFNTLNNLYALARKKSDQTPEVVMRLSQLLRFMLYDAAKPLIPLCDEIRMLEDYIDLEKIRYGDKLTLHFSKDIKTHGLHISPLLLLPFVENAFKHGASESRFASFIDMDLKVTEGILKFSVKNSTESLPPSPAGAPIGLQNVKRQLELLYTDYTLDVAQEHAVFIVFLTINLNSYATNHLPHRGRRTASSRGAGRLH